MVVIISAHKTEGK